MIHTKYTLETIDHHSEISASLLTAILEKVATVQKKKSLFISKTISQLVLSDWKWPPFWRKKKKKNRFKFLSLFFNEFSEGRYFLLFRKDQIKLHLKLSRKRRSGGGLSCYNLYLK